MDQQKLRGGAERIPNAIECPVLLKEKQDEHLNLGRHSANSHSAILPPAGGKAGPESSRWWRLHRRWIQAVLQRNLNDCLTLYGSLQNRWCALGSGSAAMLTPESFPAASVYAV